jgi:CubicO group peptidase (beta-lactamase class C family)
VSQAIQLELHGDVDARFSDVAETFLAGFDTGRDVGAALAVLVDGAMVADVWAGHVDRRRQHPWQRDTLCCLFSATKGVTALCLLQAVAEGRVALNDPVAAYWPEFGVHGKSDITVRHLLNHQAGMVGFHEPVDADLLYDWNATCEALAEERPWWPPGSKHGYHARTFGYLLGEVLRRGTGWLVGEWLERNVAGPLDLDLHIGLHARDLDRCAQMLPARVRAGQNDVPESAGEMMRDFRDLSTPTGAAFQNPSLGPGYMNSTRFRAAEMPAANGHGTARGLATLYANVPRLLPAELLAEATTTESLGMDEVLKSVSHFGLGFMLHHPEAPIGIRPGTFGHAGAGGSMAFCDPGARLAFCFVMNQMQQGVVTGGMSAMRCAESVYDCL